MNPCPNINLTEWKKLAEAVGEGEAHLAYIRNGFEIPTPERAAELLRGGAGKAEKPKARQQAPSAPPPKATAKDPVEAVQGAVDGTKNPLKRGVELSKKLAEDAQDFMTIDSTPKLRRVEPELATRAREVAYAMAAVEPMINDKLAEIFPDRYTDPEAMAKTYRVLIADRILGDYDRRLKSAEWAAKNDRPDEAEEYRALARDIAHAHDLNELQDVINGAKSDPQIMADVARWKKATQELDQWYGELKQVDQWSHDTGTGRNLGARINLLPMKKAEADAARKAREEAAPSIGTPTGSKASIKRDPFARLALATGGYSDDVREALGAVYRSRWPNVTKLRFYKQLLSSGAAVIDSEVEARPETIQGQKPAKMEITLPETDKDTGAVRNVPHTIWVRSDLVEEVRRALRTDLDTQMHPASKWLTELQLAQLADPIAHAKNQHTLIANLPALRADWKTVLRKMPLMGTTWAIKQVHDVFGELKADTPEVRKELADMARAGLIRQPGQPGGISNVLGTHDALYKADTATRVLMNRFFTEAVRAGIAENTPENRAKFVSQVGEYNTRLMGDLSARAKQAGLSPFIVAGRNFNRAGRRILSGNPGFDTTSRAAEAKVRGLNLLLGVVAGGVLTMILNLITTKSLGGRAGTPIGAWDTGRSEKDGKHTVVDLFQLSGLRRGLRATGLNALIEGLRNGKGANAIAGDIIGDVNRSFVHPFIGPAAGFAIRAGLGVNPDMRGGPQPTTARNVGGGALQYAEQARVALENQNMLLYWMLAPALGEHSKPYFKGVGRSLWKAPASALGIQELRSPAELLAFEKERAMRPVGGATPEAIGRWQLRRDIIEMYADDPDAARAKLAEAHKAKKLTDFDVRAIGKELAGGSSALVRVAQHLKQEDLEEVLQIASPEEKEALLPWRLKHAAAEKEPKDVREIELRERLAEEKEQNAWQNKVVEDAASAGRVTKAQAQEALLRLLANRPPTPPIPLEDTVLSSTWPDPVKEKVLLRLARLKRYYQMQARPTAEQVADEATRKR